MQFAALFAVHLDGDGDGVDLVVVGAMGEAACFVDKVCIPRTADEVDASLFSEGEPAEGAGEFITFNADTAKGASPDMSFAPQVLDDGMAVCREFDAVLGVRLAFDASQNVSPLFGIFDAPTESAVDIHIASFIKGYPQGRGVIGVGIF